MTAADIIAELKSLGTESYRKTLMTHGIKEPCFGVKVEDMKKIVKREKLNYQLALDLYATGIYDAMYLAGLLADDKRMTKKDLQRWVDQAYCDWLSEYAVPWVASESDHGWELGLKWIESPKERVAAAGWGTLASLVAIKDDAELDLAAYKGLLGRVGKTIHEQPNRVRYAMNSFVIAVGGYVKSLNKLAKDIAKKIGPVSVDMGDTACKIPLATDYIKKMEARGTLGRKRKSAKC